MVCQVANQLKMEAQNQSRAEGPRGGLDGGSLAREFKDLFCAYTNSPREKFEQILFKRSLYPHARLVAPILMRLKPGLFVEDFAVIQELANVDCPGVFQMEVSRFYGRNVRDRSLLRKWMLIRLSGKRLLKWKSKCFSEESGI